MAKRQSSIVKSYTRIQRCFAAGLVVAIFIALFVDADTGAALGFACMWCMACVFVVTLTGAGSQAVMQAADRGATVARRQARRGAAPTQAGRHTVRWFSWR